MVITHCLKFHQNLNSSFGVMCIQRDRQANQNERIKYKFDRYIDNKVHLINNLQKKKDLIYKI